MKDAVNNTHSDYQEEESEEEGEMDNPRGLNSSELRGQFVIGNVEPFIGGGLFIQIMFIDHPNDVYSAWVYSFVDEEREKITGYECRMFKKEPEFKSG